MLYRKRFRICIKIDGKHQPTNTEISNYQCDYKLWSTSLLSKKLNRDEYEECRKTNIDQEI